jgi:hypothetical protein
VLDIPSSPSPQVALLLALLADPANADLSNREVGRRLKIDQKFVAGFRAALASRECAALAPGASTPSEVRPSPSGHGCEPTTLNSYDHWVRATPPERTKFVDSVGMSHLLAAAPPDHRSAFRGAIIAEIAAAGMQRAVALPTRPVPDIPTDLSIPNFLKRTDSAAHATAAGEPAPCNGAGPIKVASTEEADYVG